VLEIEVVLEPFLIVTFYVHLLFRKGGHIYCVDQAMLGDLTIVNFPSYADTLAHIDNFFLMNKVCLLKLEFPSIAGQSHVCISQFQLYVVT
jgi:hypothetical protein